MDIAHFVESRVFTGEHCHYAKNRLWTEADQTIRDQQDKPRHEEMLRRIQEKKLFLREARDAKERQEMEEYFAEETRLEECYTTLQEKIRQRKLELQPRDWKAYFKQKESVDPWYQQFEEEACQHPEHDILVCKCRRERCDLCNCPVKICGKLDHKSLCPREELQCPVCRSFKAPRSHFPIHYETCSAWEAVCRSTESVFSYSGAIYGENHHVLLRKDYYSHWVLHHAAEQSDFYYLPTAQKPCTHETTDTCELLAIYHTETRKRLYEALSGRHSVTVLFQDPYIFKKSQITNEHSYSQPCYEAMVLLSLTCTQLFNELNSLPAYPSCKAIYIGTKKIRNPRCHACSRVVFSHEMDTHKKHCPKNLIQCMFCSEEIQYNGFHTHLTEQHPHRGITFPSQKDYPDGTLRTVDLSKVLQSRGQTQS